MQKELSKIMNLMEKVCGETFEKQNVNEDFNPKKNEIESVLDNIKISNNFKIGKANLIKDLLSKYDASSDSHKVIEDIKNGLINLGDNLGLGVEDYNKTLYSFYQKEGDKILSYIEKKLNPQLFNKTEKKESNQEDDL